MNSLIDSVFLSQSGEGESSGCRTGKGESS